MGSIHDCPTEAPIIRISTESELRDALARVRKLENVELNTADGLERSALEIAIATYLKLRRSRDHYDGAGGTDG